MVGDIRGYSYQIISYTWRSRSISNFLNEKGIFSSEGTGLTYLGIL